MRIIFAGHQNWGVMCLEALADSRHEVLAVVTYPDSFDLQSGPYHEVYYSSVSELARRLSLPLFQPESINDPESLNVLEGMNADVVMNVAYGQIYHDRALQMASGGVVNLHGSLLPRHRGITPVASALLEGDSEVGVTGHLMVREIDRGPVLAQKTVKICPSDHASDVFDLTYPLYPSLCLEILGLLETGDIRPTPQDESLATYVPRRTRAEERIDWQAPIENIRRMVRALSHPFRGAWTTMDDHEVIFWRLGEAMPTIAPVNVPYGTVLSHEGQTLRIAANGGTLSVTKFDVVPVDDDRRRDVTLTPGARFW